MSSRLSGAFTLDHGLLRLRVKSPLECLASSGGADLLQ
jgi:hypothetical protein